MAGSTISAVVDATFSRFRHGTKAISGVIALRFSALSLKDPTVTRTIATASASLKLHFSKPLAAFQGAQSLEQAEPSRASDLCLKPPTSEEQLIVLVSFDEALARAAEQIHARTEDLSQIPLLVSQSKSFHKRFDDVMSGKRESLNLPSQLKQFMRRRFPDYSFEAADSEQVWFRKSLAPTLDLLLMFDRIYHHGLGKTFTLELGVDFPNTRFGGMYTGWGGTRKNLFWMFHQGWEKQVWAYTTARELTTVLEACGRLLERVLPAIEQQCQQLLLPPPAAFPSGISQHGPLSARQAYEVARSGADKWTSDAELDTINSSSQLALRRQVGQAPPSITENGRLTPHSGWGFKFLSEHLDSYCYYQVPHTGRVWSNFYSLPQGGIPKYSAVLEFDDWLDSSVIAPQAFVALRERYSSFAADTSSLVLHDPNRYSGNFIWELTCDGEDGSGSKRKTITVQLDCRSGRVLGTSVR